MFPGHWAVASVNDIAMSACYPNLECARKSLRVMYIKRNLIDCTKFRSLR